MASRGVCGGVEALIRSSQGAALRGPQQERVQSSRVLQHAHPLATQAHLRQIGMDYLDQLLGGIHLA
jgi:hypothetical protein